MRGLTISVATILTFLTFAGAEQVPIPIYHTYMVDTLCPELGDKALCGHVKHTDDADQFGAPPFQVCAVCLDLEDFLDRIADEADEECAW